MTAILVRRIAMEMGYPTSCAVKSAPLAPEANQVRMVRQAWQGQTVRLAPRESGERRGRKV